MAAPKRTAFGIKFDVSSVEALADKLASLTPEAISVLMVDTINGIADSTYELARKTMLGGINLTDAYVQRKMQVIPATAAKPSASIVAFGDKPDLTGISHYGAIQRFQRVFNTDRSRGDVKRGIPAGLKADGMSAEIIKGSRKAFEHAFTLPGKKDTEGNALVFARKKDTNKIVMRRGPAVYMLFRVAAGTIEDQVYGDLGQAVIDEAERQFQKELSA